jgi:hypothetical protein
LGERGRPGDVVGGRRDRNAQRRRRRKHERDDGQDRDRDQAERDSGDGSLLRHRTPPWRRAADTSNGRPGTGASAVCRIACVSAAAGFGSVTILPIEHDTFRFYRLDL